MSTEELRGRAKSYNESVNVCFCRFSPDGKEACHNCKSLTALLEQVAAEARLRERELCIDDIQEAIGDWGGERRPFFTEAMKRAIAVIENRAKGLDQWGNPLSAAALAKQSGGVKT